MTEEQYLNNSGSVLNIKLSFSNQQILTKYFSQAIHAAHEYTNGAEQLTSGAKCTFQVVGNYLQQVHWPQLSSHT